MFAPPVAKPTTKSAEPQRATVVPQLPSQAAVTQAQLLQRRIGNQAMIRLLAQRASVTRNEPGAQEKEADAARTAGREAAPSWDFSKIPVFSPGRAERFQMPPLFPAPRLPIQAKLKVGAVDDPLEHEADRVAEQVMRMPAPEVSAAAPPQVSRKCDSCEEDEKLQKKPAGPEAAAGEAPGIVHEVLRSPGQPLDAATRGYFEPRFRHDFGQVRVHTDAKAAESAQAVNALAYTMGRDVVFEAGQYAPEKIEGQRLLAHELAHVVQQQGISPTIQKKDGGAADSGWTELAQKARKARVSGNLKEATKLYQEAIVAAVAGAIFPAGLAKTTPKPEDIRMDYELFKKGPDAAFAETRSKEVPANETNYWRWIYFAPESVLDTQAHTEAVITHELVHVHQYEKLWNAYKSDKSEGKPSWEEYIKPYSRTKRVLGPEELEAHVTSLDFLERLSIAGGDDSEQVQTLRGLFVAYIRTSDYTPAKGETMAITTAVTGP